MSINHYDYSHLRKSDTKRILCLGDCMLDKFVYGQVERISPEAPIPVFQETNENIMLGGAANVAANIAAYGCSVEFVSVIGDDVEGNLFEKIIKSAPHINAHLLKEKNRPTTLKTRYITTGHHLLRVDKETRTFISKEIEDKIIQLLPELIQKSDIILISDYMKGFLTASLSQMVIQIANQFSKIVLVDPKGGDYTKYQGATILTPNRGELKQATAMPVTTDADIILAARSLIEKYNVSSVLATRSQEGMSLITQTNEHHIPTEAKQVYDVSGAGDTTVATLALALACEIPLVEACEIANVAAGIAVGKLGTAIVYPEELSQQLLKKYNSHLPEKLINLEEAKIMVDRWRKTGKKIGFTNGCFDLIHPGHTTLIKKAKQLCDILIIGLNSDSSVKALKGETRPIQNEFARASVLSSLSHTDLIVIFNELTPINIIESLLPDVLIKGSDYTIDQVVGADIVIKNGGKVELVDLVASFSTSSIISRISS